MTTTKICGIAEIRTAKAATATTTQTTAHFKCAISNFVVGRAGKNETEVFLLHLVVPSLPSFPSLQCRVVVSLQNTKNDWWPWKLFRSVGWKLELFTRKDSIHSAAALLYYRRQRFPSQTRCFPSQVTRSLTRSRSAKRRIRRCWSTKYGGDRERREEEED